MGNRAFQLLGTAILGIQIVITIWIWRTAPNTFNGVRPWLFGSILIVAWFFFWPRSRYS